MATHAERIHKALTQRLLAGPFHPMTYVGREMSVDTSRVVEPSTALAFETSSSFGLPIRNRRVRREERLSWEWQGFVEFPYGVSCEAFEEDLCESPILIPRDGDLRQITIKLLGADYEHPTRQQPSEGTKASFRFEAELSPV